MTLVRRKGWGKEVKLCLGLSKRGDDFVTLKALLSLPFLPFSSSPQKSLIYLQSKEWEGGESVVAQRL